VSYNTFLQQTRPKIIELGVRFTKPLRAPIRSFKAKDLLRKRGGDAIVEDLEDDSTLRK